MRYPPLYPSGDGAAASEGAIYLWAKLPEGEWFCLPLRITSTSLWNTHKDTAILSIMH